MDEDLASKSDEYRNGWRAGWKAAVEASQRNRDHFMRLTGTNFPFETHEEAARRIYGSPWEEQHNVGSEVNKAVAMMRDAVDLYVVLPRCGSARRIAELGRKSPFKSP